VESITKLKGVELMKQKIFFAVSAIVLFAIAILVSIFDQGISGNVTSAGIFTTGCFSAFRGKIGGVVGSKWKSIDVGRIYVVPSNPNTPAQQTVRERFSAVQAYASSLLSTLIQTYWDPFYNTMSGYNAFIGANYSLLSNTDTFDEDCVVSKGTLEPLPSITSASVTGTTLTLTFDETISGNGLATDVLKCVVHRVIPNTLHFCTSSQTRADSPATITVPSGTTDDDYVYVFLHRGTGSSFMVSDSLSKIVTVP